VSLARSTPLLQDWLGDDAAKRHRREIHFPTGRFGEAIEQAHAVLFLASDESSFVNGTDFVVDGGMTKVRSSPSSLHFLLLPLLLPTSSAFFQSRNDLGRSRRSGIDSSDLVVAAFVRAPLLIQDITQAYVTPEGPPTVAPANFAR